jgi:penicillin G amidase
MRSLIVATACVLGGSALGCGAEKAEPVLRIEPSGNNGTVEITAPTTFTAVLENTTVPAVEVLWATNGSGKLSNEAGSSVTFAPPAGTATSTLIATVGNLTASLQISSGPAPLTDKTIPGLTAPVTVLYDAREIPHIKCAATIDCVAVQGYVQARDRLFQMDFLRHVARSRLSEMIGVLGLSQDVQLRTLFTTRAGKRIEDDLAVALDEPTAALLRAYAEGVNAYLNELRRGNGRLPGEYDQLVIKLTPADIRDWEIQDTLALGRLQQFQLSETLSEESASGQFASVFGPGGRHADLGKLNAWIRTAAPTTEQAHTLSPGPTQPTVRPAVGTLPAARIGKWKRGLGALAARSAVLREALRPAEGVGSNNWVVSAAKSASGMAMVANDPHLQLQYPPLFHLAVLTSTRAEDNLDVTGGSFPGIPGALIGRGKNVGWGVTVVGYDVTDLYLEQFLPQANCPSPAPCVLFRNVPTPTLPVPQTFRVRIGPGAAGLVDARTLNLANPPPPAVLVVPHHGPIVEPPDAGGRAVSFRWTGHEGNTQDSRAFLELSVAKDVDEAMKALNSFAVGAQNFVIADDAGNIAYYPHALVPVRRFADARVVGANVRPPWFPLPGDGTAEWGDGTSNCASATATPVPATCWIADAELPQGKNPAKGYFFTANADPTFPSVSDDNNPLAHPPYLSFSWSDSTGFRATQIEQRLAAATAGVGKVSLADMESIQADTVSRPGRAFAPFIEALPTAGSPPELAAAQQVLQQWRTNGFDCPTGLTGIDPQSSAPVTDAKVLQSSAGCFLFHNFLRVLHTNVFTDDLRLAGQGVNGGAALKAMLFLLGLPDDAPGTTFCNDVDAAGQLVTAHTCPAQAAIALVQAYKQLVANVGPSPSSWLWGRVHTIRPVPPVALVMTGYSPGPYARPGGAFTVDVGNPNLAGTGLAFGISSSANVRHISVMDPTEPAVRMQLPGPQRDVPDSVTGPDLLGQWVRNSYFDYAVGSQADGVAVASEQFEAP